MRKYRVDLEAVEARLYGSLVVEAEDEEQAKELALASAYKVSFKHSYDHDLLFASSAKDVGPIQSCRKMASIQRVSDTWAIPDADAIEGCQVLGWKCVIKKGELKPGDLCVYFEIDSILPKQPEYEFMESRHYRVRTVKLRGQVAQGLALPLNHIKYADLSSFSEGDDVTEVLGVIKYEPNLPACLRGKVAGNFPGFIPKTDEERIQSMPGILKEISGRMVVATEKLDGTNVMVYFHQDGSYSIHRRRNPNKEEKKFDIQPRNEPITEGDPTYQHHIAAVMYFIQENPNHGLYGAVHGEAIGKKIATNRYDLDHPIWVPFRPPWITVLKDRLDDGLVSNTIRSFEGLKRFLTTEQESVAYPGRPIEGVVFHNWYDSVKIKVEDFWDVKQWLSKWNQ